MAKEKPRVALIRHIKKQKPKAMLASDEIKKSSNSISKSFKDLKKE